MTYGAPRDESDLPAYLTRVRGGREPAAELVAEMARRYRAIGGSPLVRMTQAQAAALERELGVGYRVRAAMRFSDPSIAHVAHELAGEVDELVGIVLSPQWSDVLMSGYERALADAASIRGSPWRLIRGWHAEPAFVELVGALLRDALQNLDRPAILLTAHSVPRRVYDAEPEYIDQLRNTAEAIARAAGLRTEEWRFAYQSAGHT